MRRRSSGSSAEDVEDDTRPSTAGANSASARNWAGGKLISNFDDFAKSQESAGSATNRQVTAAYDRRRSLGKRPGTARSDRPNKTNWKSGDARNASLEKDKAPESTVITVPPIETNAVDKMADARLQPRRSRLRSPWSMSLLTLFTTALAILSIFVISHSFLTRQLDPKGCRMSYMRPDFARLEDFDTEHTRFASKYSVYLYREDMVDEDMVDEDIKV
jgi:glycosylphosphatidylinositol deacylase